MKIVINKCYGGFSLSNEALLHYAKLRGITLTENVQHKGMYFIDGTDDYFLDLDIERNDPCLVQTIEEIGSEAASGQYSKLAILEIPDDVHYSIRDYDGMETIHEDHRSWG